MENGENAYYRPIYAKLWRIAFDSLPLIWAGQFVARECWPLCSDKNRWCRKMVRVIKRWRRTLWQCISKRPVNAATLTDHILTAFGLKNRLYVNWLHGLSKSIIVHGAIWGVVLFQRPFFMPDCPLCLIVSDCPLETCAVLFQIMSVCFTAKFIKTL